MKPFRACAHLLGARALLFAAVTLTYAMFDFLLVGPTVWGAVTVLPWAGMAYTLTAKIPMRTRLFRLVPTVAVLLAVGLAAAPLPNSTPSSSPPLHIADCHEMDSGRAPCAQPCAQGVGAKRPPDSALDPCISSAQPGDTLSAGAPRPERGGA
jgi:hypothetical protein